MMIWIASGVILIAVGMAAIGLLALLMAGISHCDEEDRS
jgi:hypothetical protein